MSKMGQELEDRLDANKYEMYEVCLAIMRISWALRECGYHTLVNLAEQVLVKIEGGK